MYNELPDNHTPVEGLFLAGEYTESSSIHGAMHSGGKGGEGDVEGEVGNS